MLGVFHVGMWIHPGTFRFRPTVGRAALVVFCLAWANKNDAHAQPVISASAIPSGQDRLNIKTIEENAAITLSWSATFPIGETYHFELSVDHSVNDSRAEQGNGHGREFFRLQLEPGSQELNNGQVELGKTYSFRVFPQLLIQSDRLPGGVDPRDDQTIQVNLSVFPMSSWGVENPPRSAVYSWTFRYDSRRPPAPKITEILPGERRLIVHWTSTATIIDVQTIDVLWEPSVASTGTITISPENPTHIATGIGKTSTEFAIEEGLENDVVAAVALRTVDPYGNKGHLSPVVRGTPKEVFDYWEIYKSRGGQESGGFCFVATAAHGSYAASAVWPLRAFRDHILASTPLGRASIASYYRWSPPVANAIAQDATLRERSRRVLLPIALFAGALVVVPWMGIGIVIAFVLRRKRTGTAASAVPFVVAALLVSALLGEQTAHAARPKSTSPLGVGLEFKGGPYLPALADEASFVDVFGKAIDADHSAVVSERPLFRLGVDLQLFRGFGTVGVGGSVGFIQFVGRGFFDSAAQVRSHDVTLFNVLPLELTAVYRFDWLADHASIPLVPYVRGGLGYSVWWVTNGRGDTSRYDPKKTPTEDDDLIGQGGKIGLVGTVGMAILLNFIEEDAARKLYESTHLRGTYAFFEYGVSSIDGFGGDGFNLSDQNWSIGLYLER